MIARWCNERGVAMVTVLFVGAALTAVASAGAFVTVQEFRAGANDRNLSETLGYAEAGIDRLTMEIKRGNVTWRDLSEAGCEKAPLAAEGTVGNGKYRAEFTVYDPSAPAAQRVPPSPWASSNDTLRPCKDASGNEPPTIPRTPQYFAITSVGTLPDAAGNARSTQVVRQIVQIGLLGLPVGIAADSVTCNGTPNIKNHVMLVRFDIEGREACGFSETNPFYTLDRFWSGQSATTPIPASVHSVGTIYLKKSGEGTGRVRDTEHPPPDRNCDANPKGTAGQSMWDQSGRGGTITQPACAGWSYGPPPDSKFSLAELEAVAPKPNLSDQDYLVLRDSAKQTGLYCLFRADGTKSCTQAGQTWTYGGNIQTTDVDPVIAKTPNFVAYFEYENPNAAFTTNEIQWKAEVKPCSTSSTQQNYSSVIVVRNGSLKIESPFVNGAVFLPEGAFRTSGSFNVNGTVIARRFENFGNGTYSLDPCWVENMPGPFLDVKLDRFMEIDR